MNTARPVVAGGTGATTASAARTALGLAIGTDVQAFDAGLASIAGLTTAADRMIYTTASDVYAVATLTAAGRAILDDADATAQRTTLGLGTVATESIVPLAKGGTGVALVDPNADRLLFWDDSAGAVAFASVTGMAFSGTVLASGARVLLATKTASASATLDFTEFDNATYKWYEFEFEDLLPATDATILRLRTSTNGGSSYDAAGSDYSYGNVMMEDGGTPANDNASAAAFINLIGGSFSGIGNAAGELGVRGTVKIYGAGSATSKTTVMGSVSGESSISRLVGSTIFGRRNAAQDTDAVRFLFSSGNITSGTIRMYGIAA
jgi:hypothetical protein